MSKALRETESCYSLRRKKFLRLIRGEAALFVSAPEVTKSRDQHFPFQQNTDLIYLTGITEAEVALLLLGTNRGPRSVLYLRDRNPLEERWLGERLGLKRAKRMVRVDEVRNISQLPADLPQLLNGVQTFHFAPGVHPTYDALVWGLFQSSIGPRYNSPHTLKDSRLITSEMRFVKERSEIQALKHAAEITGKAMLLLAPRIREAANEVHAARLLESFFSKLGAHGCAFETIVASGRNATELHHRPQLQPLWRRELVLIDAGATFRGYSGDVTRTLPASGKFSEPQAQVYDTVHSALVQGIAKVRPGATLEEIHETVTRSLIKGLLDLGILKGNAGQLYSSGEFRRFYMHRTSHWLGLDVHDCAPVSFNAHAMPASLRPLVAGNVFTIEPGLYFDAKDETVPAAFRGIGVRLEDDILVTPTGREVISAVMPSSRTEIEALMS